MFTVPLHFMPRENRRTEKRGAKKFGFSFLLSRVRLLNDRSVTVDGAVVDQKIRERVIRDERFGMSDQ